MASGIVVTPVPGSPTVVCTSCILPTTDLIAGGFALTGFIDVEKVITITPTPTPPQVLFLEKKLPFQILVMGIDPPA
jgi:hypothetical protein